MIRESRWVQSLCLVKSQNKLVLFVTEHNLNPWSLLYSFYIKSPKRLKNSFFIQFYVRITPTCYDDLSHVKKVAKMQK